jgi:secreted trypsin-like serine protease
MVQSAVESVSQFHLILPNAVAIPSMKALDVCGVPHAQQEGDIAFLIANGQKGPRANIYRAKRSNGREERVTNSMVAQENEVCWMAAIILDGKYQSGASIVSERYVLTAAHEVDGRDISRLRIRVGDIDVRQGSLGKDKNPGCVQDLAVDQIILHPDFDRKTLSSDIGLIKLKDPIDLSSPCVCKVCLQEEGPQEGETCIISGFGSTRVVDPSKSKTEEDAFALSGPNAEILRYAGIPIVANDVCSAAFKNEKLAPKLKAPFGILDDTQICAGGISQRDACYGDGGSPLVCYNGRSFYQAGVVSYGRGCGKALMAAVYGSVTAATPWITEEILSNRQ